MIEHEQHLSLISSTHCFAKTLLPDQMHEAKDARGFVVGMSGGLLHNQSRGDFEGNFGGLRI